jgi:hypothetical protein
MPSLPAPWTPSPRSSRLCAALWRKQRTVGKSVSPLICRPTSGQGGGGSGGVAGLRLLSGESRLFLQEYRRNQDLGVLSGIKGTVRKSSSRQGLPPFVFALPILLLAGRMAPAQSGASIAGLVRDASGGVLPGVTIPATNPALIEKIRLVITDCRRGLPRSRYRLIFEEPTTRPCRSQ